MNEYVTVIQFATLVDKAPQQIYPKLKNGSFPKEFVSYQPKASGGTQPMILKEEAIEWFANKELARTQKLLPLVTNVYTAEQLIADLEAAGKKGLVTQIRNFMAASK